MEIPILLAAFGPNFNTSHVYINRFFEWNAFQPFSISIHLMFILIILCNRLIALDIKWYQILTVAFFRWIFAFLCSNLLVISPSYHVYINLHMATWGDHQQDFNTSHVYINPLTFITYRQPAIISIHLMFILISYVRRCRRRWESISIHLMFILISFKTSSKGLSIIISIHLMFILICLELTPPAAAFRFQYISCLY